MGSRPNILFIVIDQLRADCLHGALAGYLDMPNLRALADDAVRFDTHFTVTTPCGPSRVSLLTGQYAMNHRAVRNGTPLKDGTPTLATEARAAGYDPLLFGYTDTSKDPRGLPPDDPRLFSYEELAPGFTEVLRMRQESDDTAWYAHLARRGIAAPAYPDIYIPDGPDIDAPAKYAAEDSDTAFLTDRVLEDLAQRPPGWFACVTYIRPHPPLVAPAPYNTMYEPDAMPSPQGWDVPADWHPFVGPARARHNAASTVTGFPDLDDSDTTARRLRALYFGLATEVDHHIGRLIAFLEAQGIYDDTLIVVTSDHGESLGDHHVWGKQVFYDASFHVPLFIRDTSRPEHHGRVVTAPTESVDVAPTLLDLLGLQPPDSMDGQSLVPWLAGNTPDGWRDTTYSEVDFGDPVRPMAVQSALGLPATHCNYAVLRTARHRLIQFAADLPPILFDMEAAGENHDLAGDPGNAAALLSMTQKMLRHRMSCAEGTFARTMVTEKGVLRGMH